MLALDDPRWATLSHAYGRADDIPALLVRGRDDVRPGHKQGSSWFDLWSALCHQGDAYTASYAAVPHLVAYAPDHLRRKRYDPLLLAACINLARLEGRGPVVPPELVSDYNQAIERARVIAEGAIELAWDTDSELALQGSALALAGDVPGAQAVFARDE